MINFTTDTKILSRRGALSREADRANEEAHKQQARVHTLHKEIGILDAELSRSIGAVLGKGELMARVVTPKFKIEGLISFNTLLGTIYANDLNIRIPCRDIISIKEINI